MPYASPMPQPESGYRSVSLPAELIEAIRRLPLEELGYVSSTEVVKDAVREKLRALTEQRRQPELDALEKTKSKRAHGGRTR